MAQERVQKVIANLGLCSRRDAEELIRLGSVTINGELAKIGDKADVLKDAIKVNGKLITSGKRASLVYLALHKPKGVLATLGKDRSRRKTLDNYLKRVQTRVFPVGRMDYNGEGLILLTNDGDLAEKVQKTKKLLRTYHVKSPGFPEAKALARLSRGAMIEGKRLKPVHCQIIQKFTKKVLIEIAFLGSGTIPVKEFFNHKGFLVDRVTRFGIGHISVKGIASGEFKRLKKSQFEALVEHPELAEKIWQKRKVEPVNAEANNP